MKIPNMKILQSMIDFFDKKIDERCPHKLKVADGNGLVYSLTVEAGDRVVSLDEPFKEEPPRGEIVEAFRDMLTTAAQMYRWLPGGIDEVEFIAETESIDVKTGGFVYTMKLVEVRKDT